jgi:hypothetical protein
MVQWEPDEGAMERDRMVRIAHDRNGDKADVADAAGSRKLASTLRGSVNQGYGEVKTDAYLGEAERCRLARPNRAQAPLRRG